MKKNILPFIAIIAVMLNACDDTVKKNENTAEIAASEKITNKEKAIQLVENYDASKNHVDLKNVKIHQADVSEDESGKAFFFNQESRGKVKILHALEDGNKVAIHYSSELNGNKSVNWAVYNFNKLGQIDEVWTNKSPEMKPNASGRTMIDGTTQISDLDKTKENKSLMENFFSDIIIGGKFELAANYYDGDKLIEHDPNAGDGAKALIDYAMGLAKAGKPQIFNKVHLLIAEGDFVLVATDYSQAKIPGAYFELYRLENKKIAERWLVNETIATQENWKNKWGKF